MSVTNTTDPKEMEAFFTAVRKLADKFNVHSIVVVGLTNDGDTEISVAIGTDGYEFQTIGCLELAKAGIVTKVLPLRISLEEQKASIRGEK